MSMNKPSNSITLSTTPYRFGWSEPGGTFIGYQSSVGPLFQLDQVKAFADYMNPMEYEHRDGAETYLAIAFKEDVPWVETYEKRSDGSYGKTQSRPMDEPVPGYFDMFFGGCFLHGLEESVGLGPAPDKWRDGPTTTYPEPATFRDRLHAGFQESGKYGNGDDVMHSWVEGAGAWFSTEQMGGKRDWHFESLYSLFYYDYDDVSVKDPTIKDYIRYGVHCIKQAVLGDQEGDEPLYCGDYEEFLEKVVAMLFLARAARVHMPKGSPLRHDLDQEIHWNGAREFGDKEEVCILRLLSGT